ncbi:hypothetical protein FRB94_004080 [Tulasnella sp. JGI-2019a]|nr:hypothetical protein FRB94_004080 [Tulasnella sp. JGI-2019a]KAG9026888.1 hypothetical protein FRB95_008341 [Tulasnella sp. JGI-2019a]
MAQQLGGGPGPGVGDAEQVATAVRPSIGSMHIDDVGLTQQRIVKWKRAGPKPSGLVESDAEVDSDAPSIELIGSKPKDNIELTQHRIID